MPRLSIRKEVNTMAGVICPFNEKRCGTDCVLFDQKEKQCSIISILDALNYIGEKVED